MEISFTIYVIIILKFNSLKRIMETNSRKQSYDLSLKELFSQLPTNFVKIISGFEPKSIISTEYQDFQLKPDFVVELINGDILHIEFQRTNDP
ncbi:MAG: hypothetical protein ACP5KF_06880, partial [Sulfurihydrogenibium sp.]